MLEEQGFETELGDGVFEIEARKGDEIRRVKVCGSIGEEALDLMMESERRFFFVFPNESVLYAQA